jgi:UDP-N-acetylmuramoyl-L-alanyl-D-glutamate--2,6-diaminopimelate ligase
MQNLLLRAKTEILHSTSNSKEARKGSVFFALRGKTFDGHNFINHAIQNGAKFILYSNSDFNSKHEDATFILIPFLEAELENILNDLYPSLPSKVIAITGTNGKTSACFLGAGLFSLLFGKSGCIGTTGVYLFQKDIDSPEKIAESSLTTPDSISLFYYLAILKGCGADYIFFEASSIGIEQNRIKGIKISCACFTNFTQDHLDYHGNMEEYFFQKTRLFSEYLQAESFAVFNADDKIISKNLLSICNSQKIKYYDFSTKSNRSSIFAFNCKLYPQKIIFDTNFFTEGRLNLSGEFQLQNILCILGVALGFGVNLSEIKELLWYLKPPRGRLEKVESPFTNTPTVFIDYAHTPDSLLKAILSLKQIKSSNGKLLVLFGCGGERDSSKRKIMGEIASKEADFTIVTDDNPRNEEPFKIRQDILSGMKDSSNFKEIEGRADAIKYIISIARSNDIILLAGKGHEDYQIIGNEKFFFDDYECALESLLEMKSVHFNN